MIPLLYQLSYTAEDGTMPSMVLPERVELPTFRLQGGCSTGLSYKSVSTKLDARTPNARAGPAQKSRVVIRQRCAFVVMS